MSDYTSKLALSLAASGMSLTEIRRAIETQRGRDLDSLIALIQEIRLQARELPKSRLDHPRSISSYSLRSSNDPSAQIDRMLRKEAGLPAKDAADLLLSLIHQRYKNNLPVVPTYNRSAFVEWVERLLRVVPPSEVLHLAARARNEIVHSTDKNWPLEDK